MKMQTLPEKINAVEVEVRVRLLFRCGACGRTGMVECDLPVEIESAACQECGSSEIYLDGCFRAQ